MSLSSLLSEQTYMYLLIFFGALTVLYVLFDDIVRMKNRRSFLNPTVMLTFFTFGTAIGYLFEATTELNHYMVMAIASFVSALSAAAIYFFLLFPLPVTETMDDPSEDSLTGQMATVIVPIPIDGYGEVVIETHSGSIFKRAMGFDNEAIRQEQEVLVIEVEDGTLFVKCMNR